MGIDWEWLTLLPLRERRELEERARRMAAELEAEDDRPMEIRACWWIGEAAAAGPGVVAAVDDWGDRGFFEDMLFDRIQQLAGPSLEPGALAYVRIRPDREDYPALWIGADGVRESALEEGEAPDSYVCDEVFVALDPYDAQRQVIAALEATGELPELVRGFHRAMEHEARARVVVPLGRADVVAIARQLEALGPEEPWSSWGEVMGWSDGAVVTWFLGLPMPWRVERPEGHEPAAPTPASGAVETEADAASDSAEQASSSGLLPRQKLGLVLLAILVVAVLLNLWERM